MGEITTVGIDLAKNVFSVHGVDAHGKTVLRKTVSRGKLVEPLAQLPWWLRPISAAPHGRKANWDPACNSYSGPRR
jgi:transposase